MTRLNVAVAGVGRWGHNILRVLAEMPRVRLAAACDADLAVTERLRTERPTLPVTRSFEDLMSNASIEAVALATPSPTHASLSMRALRAGKHVFVEKPVATCLADAYKLEACVHASGQKLMVGHVLEHHPSVLQLRRFIRAGCLGALRRIILERLSAATARPESDAWWELAPHDVSLARLLIGREPLVVRAWRRTPELVCAELEFPGSVAVSILVGRSPLARKTRRAVVLGSDAVAVFDDMNLDAKLRVLTNEPPLFAWLDRLEATTHLKEPAGSFDTVGLHELRGLGFNAAGEPLALEVGHFVDAVLDARAVDSSIESGVAVVAVLDAGVQSMAASGRPVSLAVRHSAHTIEPAPGPSETWLQASAQHGSGL